MNHELVLKSSPAVMNFAFSVNKLTYTPMGQARALKEFRLHNTEECCLRSVLQLVKIIVHVQFVARCVSDPGVSEGVGKCTSVL